MTRTLEKWTVACVLILHVSLLALSAIRHSPVVDEVGHLPAGLSHWRLQRFDLYNVNPPLVRTLAAAPLHFINVPIDFSGYQVLPQPQIGIRRRGGLDHNKSRFVSPGLLDRSLGLRSVFRVGRSDVLSLGS